MWSYTSRHHLAEEQPFNATGASWFPGDVARVIPLPQVLTSIAYLGVIEVKR